MNHIYIPYSPGALENKDELDRKIGFYIRTLYELGDEKGEPTETVTFVFFNEVEFKAWLGDRDDTKEAREHWMRQRIYDFGGGEMPTFDKDGKRIL
jgi:hypothetical protein